MCGRVIVEAPKPKHPKVPTYNLGSVATQPVPCTIPLWNSQVHENVIINEYSARESFSSLDTAN